MTDERYRLDEVIGAGGMATVWRGVDTSLDRPVAVKVISEALALDESFMRRFEREARIASSISHAAVVAVFDFDPDAERPYIVMELLEGGTLADLLAAGGEIDAERLARELLDALDHVHAAGIIHRDVKPANVLIGDAGAFRLTDFGIAQPEDATRYTRTGNVIGTLRYMAPELKEGGPASTRSDLYSAGVVIADAAGQSPSPGLTRLIAALTAGEPERRPATAAAALALLDGEPALATPAATRGATAETERVAPLAHRPGRRRAPALLGLALLAVAGVVAISLGGGDSGGRDATRPDRSEQRVPTTTVTETTTSVSTTEAPPEAAPPAEPGPPAAPQGLGGGDACDRLEARKRALKDLSKAAEAAAGDSKDARKATQERFKERERALNERIKACR